MLNKSIFIVFIYCLFSAFSRVFTNHLLQQQDPIVFCFDIFTLGAIAFILLHIKKQKVLYKKAKYHLKTICYLNLTTLGSWLFLTYPLKIIEPSLVSTITLGLGPIFSLLLAQRFYTQQQKTLWDNLIASCLCLTILYVMKLCLTTTVISLSVPLHNKLLALLCCVIVGASVVLNGFQTRKLIDHNFSTLDILSIRFFLLILVAGTVSFFYHPINTLWLGLLAPSMVFSALIFVIIPLFLIQYSLRYLAPITVSVMIPCMPVLTYFFELYDKKISPLSSSLYAILMVLSLIMLGTLIRYQHERKLSSINTSAEPS
jgi:drug/metabolite transporter (DMT)-like permease